MPFVMELWRSEVRNKEQALGKERIKVTVDEAIPLTCPFVTTVLRSPPGRPGACTITE